MNKKLLCAILACTVLAFSCKKSAHVNPQQPNTVDPPKSGHSSPDLPTTFSTMDLNGINFKASTNYIPLAATAYSIKNLKNSTVPFTMQLLGLGFTHPSVLYFDKAWHGYHYWMAITPYPKKDNQWENPTIFCSNDGLNWKEPDETTACLNLPPNSGSYNSDPALLYDEVDDTLYCYWRQNGVFTGRALYVEQTKDGITWSPKKLICYWPLAVIDVIAPSVVKDNGKYYCYGISVGETTPGTYFTNYGIRRMVSDEPTAGFVADKEKGYDLIKIANRPWGAGNEPWHLEVRKLKDVWMMLVATTRNGLNGEGGMLYLGYSNDGVNFTFADHALLNVTAAYKSSFVPTFDPQNGVVNVELWRASSDEWTIFHENFSIKVK